MDFEITRQALGAWSAALGLQCACNAQGFSLWLTAYELFMAVSSTQIPRGQQKYSDWILFIHFSTSSWKKVSYKMPFFWFSGSFPPLSPCGPGTLFWDARKALVQPWTEWVSCGQNRLGILSFRAFRKFLNTSETISHNTLGNVDSIVYGMHPQKAHIRILALTPGHLWLWRGTWVDAWLFTQHGICPRVALRVMHKNMQWGQGKGCSMHCAGQGIHNR